MDSWFIIQYSLQFCIHPTILLKIAECSVKVHVFQSAIDHYPAVLRSERVKVPY